MDKNRDFVAVGVFPERIQADRAVDELRQAGFQDQELGVVGRGHPVETGENVTAGAIGGAAAGGALGGLVGLGILAGVIPMLGPVIAGGTLAVVLANATGGAAIAGVLGALLGLGVSEDEASYYEGEVKKGRTIVTVKTGQRFDQARAILRKNGATNESVLNATPRDPVIAHR